MDSQKRKTPSSGAITRRADALAALAEKTTDYVAAAKADATLAAYRSDFADFSGWCSEHDLAAMPADARTVALYLASLADVAKVSTITRRLAAIAYAHRSNGAASPTEHPAVMATMAGIRRRHGAPARQAAPISVAMLARMVEALPPTVAGRRDAALLLLGFAAALRRSDLVSLDYGDLAWGHDGLTVTLRRSKTDQTGEGRQIGVPYGSRPSTCPVRTTEAWCQAGRISEGPLFRSVDRHGRVGTARLTPRAVNGIVAKAVASIGVDPSGYSAHSLRAGLATEAARAGVSERSIMAQTGHRSLAVARGYIRDGELFRDNAAAQVGL